MPALPQLTRALAPTVRLGLFAAAAIGVLLAPPGAVRTTAAHDAHLPRATYFEEHPVLAYYYAWWGPDVFARTLYQPFQAYESDDEAVMRRHMQEAAAAGIDGWIMSWYGYSDRTDRNLQKLQALGEQTGIRSTIHFETPLFARYGVEDIVLHLRLFYEHRINSPSMVTYQGRPVIFFWFVRLYDNATWASIRNEVDPERRAVWIADGDDFNVLNSDAWEGISPYAIAWSPNPGAQIASWGSRARSIRPDKLYVPVVSPGCDDTAARAVTCQRDRSGGAYYQNSLDGALALNNQWAVAVSTYNEWMESTQIEPSVQYGDQYLQMTRAFSDAFKGVSAGRPAAVE